MKYFFFLFLTVFLLQAQRQDIVLKIDGQVVENDSIVHLDVYIENYESGSIKLTGQKRKVKKKAFGFITMKKANLPIMLFIKTTV